MQYNEFIKIKDEAFEMAYKAIFFITKEYVEDAKRFGIEMSYFEHKNKQVSRLAFGRALILLGKRFKDNEHFVVMYSKDEDKDGNIHPTIKLRFLTDEELKKLKKDDK